MQTFSRLLFLLLITLGIHLEARGEDKRIQAVIAEMKNETPEFIISLGKPMIFGATSAMKKATEFGSNATIDLWNEIAKRDDAKVVAMCAACLQKIRPKIDIKLLESEVDYWKQRPDLSHADLAIVSLRGLKMELENKIKRRVAD